MAAAAARKTHTSRRKQRLDCSNSYLLREHLLRVHHRRSHALPWSQARSRQPHCTCRHVCHGALHVIMFRGRWRFIFECPEFVLFGFEILVRIAAELSIRATFMRATVSGVSILAAASETQAHANLLCQVIGSRERLVAMWADIGSFLCVRPYMSLEMLQTLEQASTGGYRTRVRFGRVWTKLHHCRTSRPPDGTWAVAATTCSWARIV